MQRGLDIAKLSGAFHGEAGERPSRAPKSATAWEESLMDSPTRRLPALPDMERGMHRFRWQFGMVLIRGPSGR